MSTPTGDILRLFADVLDYPGPGLAGVVRRCRELLAEGVPEAAALLEDLLTLVEGTPLGTLEEIYTGFFDLNPVCHPYVGYHLFGESYKRSVFLLGLKERYRAQGFAFAGTELPDRLSIMLRFLAAGHDAELGREIVREALLPALERMAGQAATQEAAGRMESDEPQLEGHSQGEVLSGGFVLRMAEPEPAGGPRAHGRPDHPYRKALKALQAVLHSEEAGRGGPVRQEAAGGGSHA